MAQLKPFGKDKYGKPRGWYILGVPMPNGRVRDYMAYGKDAIAKIVRCIRRDKKAMRRARIIHFSRAVA